MLVQQFITFVHKQYGKNQCGNNIILYRICPNRSRAQIQAGARIEAGSERSVSQIEAGARI